MAAIAPMMRATGLETGKEASLEFGTPLPEAVGLVFVKEELWMLVERVEAFVLVVVELFPAERTEVTDVVDVTVAEDVTVTEVAEVMATEDAMFFL